MTDRTPQSSAPRSSVRDDHRRLQFATFLDPVVVGVLATVISLGGAGRPSFWYDEAATISASYSRSLHQLWQMLGNVDAVEGLYYLLMHGWFGVFPPTEFWSRVPSGLAVGGAAAGVVVLARHYHSSRTVALACGIVCAILPRTTWAGIEARPYALSMMAAVWVTVLLACAIRRDTPSLWLCYGVALTLSVLLDIYLLLLVVAHVAFVSACERGRSTRPFALTSIVACCVLTPFAVTAVSQTHQISWVAPIGHRTIEDVTIQQYFERNPLFAVLSALVVVTAIALRRRTSAQPGESDRRLLILAIAWVLIPTVLAVVVSAVIHPVYTPRYLAFTAPAVALIVGICVVRVAPRPWAVAALIGLLTAVAVPNYLLTQRTSYAKYGMDYSQVADLVAAKAAPGDCLLVNDTVTFMPAPMRPLLAARPDTYRKLIDLSLWQRATDRQDVFDTNLIPEVVARPLARCKLVWIITQADRSMPAHEQGVAIPPGPLYGATPAFAVPRELGFRLVERWQYNLVQVIEAVR